MTWFSMAMSPSLLVSLFSFSRVGNAGLVEQTGTVNDGRMKWRIEWLKKDYGLRTDGPITNQLSGASIRNLNITGFDHELFQY